MSNGIWQPPALPYRLQYSTIGRLRLDVVFGMRTGISRKRIATRNLSSKFDDLTAGDPLLIP